MRGRHTVAMLEVLDLPDLIAQDANDYIAISTRLLADHDFYAEMRRLIAERKHRLFHDRSVATAFKQAVNGMALRLSPVSGSCESISVSDFAVSSAAAA
jgi:predicted O-linked N-acetylglucosamine transferase (SPINDLY family)